MNDNANPGSDGFEPSFFKSNWSLVKDDLLCLLSGFHNCSADPRRISKASIVLLPRIVGANQPKNFRPVSLQNCPIKITSKCLANRARNYMLDLVHEGQMGFIKGRGIAENFLFAADIVQTCHKRKVPSIVSKLDFRKAFDSVSWDALSAILCTRASRRFGIVGSLALTCQAHPRYC